MAMLKKFLALDGVLAICQFRDDGEYLEGYGVMEEQQMIGLAKFAHDYKRIVQGNADQLAMFTGVSGWTPPEGWMVQANENIVMSFGNFVCLAEKSEASINELMAELKQLSHW